MTINRRGFTLIEGLLTTMTIAVVSGVGFYVYSVKRDDDKPKTKTSQTKTNTQKSKAEPVADDATKDWKTFTDKSLSLKYPAAWVAPKNNEACGTEGLRRGTTLEAAGICQSDAVSQITVYAESGDNSKDLAPRDAYDTDIKSADVTVASVAGKRYSSTTKGDLMQAAGIKVVQYIFPTNGRTYIAIYRDDHAKYKDALSDFDLMVTKTLKFNP